jgi:hypothetical protein
VTLPFKLKRGFQVIEFGHFPYKFTPIEGNPPVEVFCDDEGWTVVQSRGENVITDNFFYRGWEQYKAGFGMAGECIILTWGIIDELEKETKKERKEICSS